MSDESVVPKQSMNNTTHVLIFLVIPESEKEEPTVWPNKTTWKV